jgi:hypothetical protein
MRPITTTITLATLLAGCSDYDLVRPDKEEPEGEEEIVEEDPPLDPDISFAPATLDFGGLPKDCFTDWQEVTITNDGQGTLEVTEIVLAGGGRSAFVVDADLPMTLEYGEAQTFRVRFKPVAWTDYDVDVEITSNDPDEPVVGPDALGFAPKTSFSKSLRQDTSTRSTCCGSSTTPAR